VGFTGPQRLIGAAMAEDTALTGEYGEELAQITANLSDSKTETA